MEEGGETYIFYSNNNHPLLLSLSPPLVLLERENIPLKVCLSFHLDVFFPFPS